jgi:hypothetical protein
VSAASNILSSFHKECCLTFKFCQGTSIQLAFSETYLIKKHRTNKKSIEKCIEPMK